MTVQAYASIGEESQDACNATVLKSVFTKGLSSTAKNVEAHTYVSTIEENMTVYDAVEAVPAYTKNEKQTVCYVVVQTIVGIKEAKCIAYTVEARKYAYI